MKTCLLFVLLFCQALCFAQTTPIYTIQGTGTSSSYDGQTISTEGLVTAVFSDLNGYTIQDQTGDANVASSDGIFVNDNVNTPTVGDKISVTADVQEYFGLTRLNNITSYAVISQGNSITPTTVYLPLINLSDNERYEGMLITYNQTLTVTDNSTLGRYGELVLSLNGKTFQPTNLVDPTDNNASNYTNNDNNAASVLNYEAGNEARMVLLDDGSSSSYPNPIPYISATDSTIRCGSTIDNLTGVLSYGFSKYRFHPTITPSFNYETRPSFPGFGNANVKVASFNLLNYWTTFGERGADDQTEFDRQKAKLAKAILTIDADVYGLLEIETNNTALNDLVTYLNQQAGSTLYAAITEPLYVGTDVIKSSIIYKPSVVSPLGNGLSPSSTIYERTPIAQTFTTVADGYTFSVVMCHFRFKGCSGSTGLDQDQNDGQSCFNYRRVQEANQLMGAFIDTIKTISQDSNILIMGDFNAYSQEDPIDVIESYGYKRLFDDNDYSYVYQGNFGLLDHAFASPTLNSQVTSARIWHINSPEPTVIDYNTENRTAQDFYQANPYRSSDHDPVLVGLNLGATSIKEDGFNQLNVYPNPSSGEVNITFKKQGNYSIEAYNSSGILLQEETINGVKASIEFKQKGVYLLKATNKLGEVFTERIIIQ